MKVTNKSFYTCDICGKTSTDERKIQTCQESHRKITEETEIEAVYQRAKATPTRLSVKFPDGVVATYDFKYERNPEIFNE